MRKLNSNQVKGISKLVSRDTLENSEFCVECLQETDITELNLQTGVCTTCKRNTKKLDKKTIERLMGLYDV